jgi:4-alpha-glucanotransferase
MQRGWARDEKAILDFAKENARWLDDYVLFMALKRRYGMVAWTEWPDEDIRLHRPAAVERCRKELEEDIRLFTYIQYLFYQQWDKLREYAHSKGVGIIGDMPIYVAMDSADVWSEPGCFQLDEKTIPTEVSGCPPDSFSADGQLWGNPLYNWMAMKKDGYGWWIRRIAGAARLYDVLRIDHFRGLESYWAIPYGAKTAKDGRWVKGPGMDLMGTLIGWFPNIRFIAEDLGFLTPEVHQLLQDSGLPGMKVLEFAFDSREPSNYLPHTYDHNCVCYAGTHDNSPIMLWKEEADPADIEMAVRYLGLNDQEGFHWGILRGGMSSVADLFVAQMQDYLGLGAGSRMNVPGILGGNWQWRMKQGQLNAAFSEKLAEMVRIYGRSEYAWQA